MQAIHVLWKYKVLYFDHLCRYAFHVPYEFVFIRLLLVAAGMVFGSLVR